MKKYSIVSEESKNQLSYMDDYEEIIRFKKSITKDRKVSGMETKLPRGFRWFIFTIFFILTTLVNMDHGTIPAATDEIKSSLNIDDNILGIFGSLVFLGNLIGASISFSIINKCNRKFLLIISLALTAFCLYSFTLTDIYYILFFNRIVVGIFQVKLFK
jgi:predicted MFS family arabinose efflux permease